MLRVDFNKKMGEVILAQEHDGKTYKFTVDICAANALCAFISKCKNDNGEAENRLLNFFADKVHVNDLIKRKVELFYGKVEKVRLNMWYENCESILKYFVRIGYKVECYYKESKNK